PQLWLGRRRFCDAISMALKSGMRIGQWVCRRDFGKRHTTVITLPILKRVRGRCTAGASRLMPLWWIHGTTLCACPVILTILRQPEYVHVLLNPLPVYGLLIAWIGLVIAAVLKSRRGQLVTLVLVLVSSLSAWPVYEFGQQAYDRVLSMTDEDGERWLDEHQDRAEDLIWVYYALAVLSAAAIAVPIKWPRSSAPLVIAVILLSAAALGSGAYIAYAGGRIRHREFRNEPAPPKRLEHEHG